MAVKASSYADIYNDSNELDLDIVESVLPPWLASALKSVQSLGFAVLIVYDDGGDEDNPVFHFKAVDTRE